MSKQIREKTVVQHRSKLPSNGTNHSTSPKSLQIAAGKFQHFEGPVPHPAVLKAYDLVLPGLAERIICAWEKQTSHRIFLEKNVVSGDINRANWGLACATLISLTVVAACTVIALYNPAQTLTAFGVVVFYLSALAGAFIYGSNSRKAEREKKSAQLKEIKQR